MKILFHEFFGQDIFKFSGPLCSGAKKLVEEKPLGKMVPVDEYLPIMYDKHPNETWKKHYFSRNLIAFSVHPLLLFPTHFTGEEGYISDTEDTNILHDEL